MYVIELRVNLPLVYLWFSSGIPLVYLWLTCGLPWVYLRYTWGQPRVYPRSTRGKPQVDPRYTPGQPQVNPCYTPGIPHRSPSTFRRTPLHVITGGWGSERRENPSLKKCRSRILYKVLFLLKLNTSVTSYSAMEYIVWGAFRMTFHSLRVNYI